MVNFYQYKNFNFNDFDLIVKDGILYAVYVKKVPYSLDKVDSKRPNRYGLAKSADGIKWEEIGDILLPDNTAWDQSLWAGSVSKQGKKFVIYYTSVKVKGRESSCKIGKAYSKDLVHWKKDKINPVLELRSDNKFYSDEKVMSFRDPFYFSYGRKRYILFCAKDKNKPQGKRGCVGAAEETSSGKFKFLKPIYSPSKYSDGLECPALYKIKNKWYLIFGLDTRNTSFPQMRYAVSESLFGPFKEPKNNTLLEEGYYIGRIVEFKGKLLYYAWFRDIFKGKIRERLAGPWKVEIGENERIILSIY